MKKTKAKMGRQAIVAALMCATVAFGAPFYGMAAEPENEENEKDNEVYLGGVVVTATRTPVEEFKANANISVITAKDIENNHWRDLSEALRNVPGVYIAKYSVTDGAMSFYINGSNDVVVLIDGVKVNMAEVKFPASMLKNLDNIERIEVLKGSSSTLYGADAKGGVVHIITKKINKNKTTVNVGGGSYGTENYSFDHEGRDKDWSWRFHLQKDIAGDFKDGDGNTNQAWVNADTYSFLLKKDFGENSDLTLTYDSFKTDNNEYQSFFEAYSTGLNISNHNWKLIYNTRFGNNTTNQLSYFNNEYDSEYLSGYVTNVKTQRISDQFTRKINDAHTLTAGFEYTQDKVNAGSSLYGFTNRDLTNTSFFIQDEWAITKQLKLTGGVRHDKPSLFDSNTSTGVNLGYEFNPDTNMYISYSEYFITPTMTQMFGQWGNSSVKPESGDTSEIGINHRISDTFTVSAHMFKRDTKSRIIFDSPNSRYDNIDREKADGWDIQFRKQFSKSTSAYLGYTHTNVDPNSERARNVDGYIPRGALNIGVDYNKDKLDLSLTGRGVFDRVGPEGDGFMYEPFFPAYTYWVWDIGVNYRTSPNAKAFVKINNIFNTYYAEQSNATSKPYWNGNPGDWWSAPGRNIYAGMQYTF